MKKHIFSLDLEFYTGYRLTVLGGQFHKEWATVSVWL